MAVTMTVSNDAIQAAICAKGSERSVLSVQHVSKAFDGVKALDDCSFEVRRGQITALIGPNGAGKTTVFNVISGLLSADHGNIQFEGQSIRGLEPHLIATLGVSRTFQDTRIFPQMTALDNLMLGMRYKKGESFLEALLKSKTMQREERDSREKAAALLDRIGLTQKASALAGELSLGQRKLLELAKTIAAGPKFLMLDEPTAGLFRAMIQEMQELIVGLRGAGTTVLFIEHNMNLVMNMSHNVIVLNYGRKIAEGTPLEIQNNEEVIKAYLGRRTKRGAKG